jgi:undecaprenyl-diphosphatase
MDKVLTKRNTIIFVGLITLWKVYLSATLQLHPDEAYYWMWSRHLAMGYFDHAPLLAYFIKLTTLFSQGELWVRFSGVLGTLALSFLTWLLSRQFFDDEKVAAGSVIALNILPLTVSGSIIITPDIPAFFFWGLSIYLYWQLVRTQKTFYWYLLGIAFGFSLLSKYTAAMFAPPIVLFMLLTDERKWFKSPHPYLGFLLGCAMFLPVVYWNMQHQWISFAFQMNHGMGGRTISFGRLFEYAGGQMLVASPFVWLFGMYAAVAYLFRKDKRLLFLSLTSLPIILFFGYTSLKSLAGPNWPACAYFTFCILFSHYLLESGSKVKRVLWAGAVVFGLTLSLLATLHARFSLIPLAKINTDMAIADATNFFYGWRELGEQLEKDPEIKFALTASHQYSAEISYYTHEKVFAYVDLKQTRFSQFNLWSFPEELRAAKGVYVHLANEAPGKVENFLATIGTTNSLQIRRNDFLIKDFQIIHGTGYKYVPEKKDLTLVLEQKK